MTARNRKKLFIDPVVQGALRRRLALHWALLLLAGFVSLLMLQVFTQGFDKPFSWHLDQMWILYGPLFIVLLCILPVFVYDSVKLSRRFVGPMYAIRRTVRELAEGRDVPPLQFRAGDFCTDITKDLNQVAARLRESSPVDVAESSRNGRDPSTLRSRRCRSTGRTWTSA